MFLSEVNDNPNIFYTSSRGVTESNIISSNAAAQLDYFQSERLIEKTEIYRLSRLNCLPKM